MDNKTEINLGAVYETIVAQELKAHNHDLYYYNRKKVGEVDYLIDDYESLNVLHLEIKSGKDFVLSNERIIKKIDKITYYPIYFIMFL